MCAGAARAASPSGSTTWRPACARSSSTVCVAATPTATSQRKNARKHVQSQVGMRCVLRDLGCSDSRMQIMFVNF